MGVLSGRDVPRRVLLAAGLLATAAAASVAAAVATRGDDGDDGRPARLVDGSPALLAPEGIGDKVAVRGTVRTLRAGDVGVSRLESCLERLGLGRLPAETIVVERVGVDGRSLTFRDPRSPRLYGCDGAAGELEPRPGPWCGGTVGTLRAGRLTDPRLNMVNCRTAAGETVAFAWIVPHRDARWLAVGEGDSREFFQTAGHLPVRATTTEGLGSDSAVVHVAQYAADGRKLAERDLELRVAG